MADITVRPSTKLIRAAYVVELLLAIAILIAGAPGERRTLLYLIIVPALLAAWTAVRHIESRLTKLTVEGQRIRFESGILSKTTRTMELHKLQDVRVDQSLGQRLLNIGDISLETAGETSRITVAGVDRPREVADRILSAADRAGRAGQL